MTNTGYSSLAGTPQKRCLFWQCLIRWSRVSVCPLPGYVHFDHLLRWCHPGFSTIKVLFSIAHLWSNKATFLLFLPSTNHSLPLSFPSSLPSITHTFLRYSVGSILFLSLLLLPLIWPVRPISSSWFLYPFDMFHYSLSTSFFFF